MTKRPTLTFWQIWNMSFGFFGIQFGFALQNANVSRIFETLGANIETIPLLWIAAPVTGLIVQPIIGHYSDKTWSRLGRRRPYFLFGAVFASLALLAMPHAPFWWFAAGLLWIMDASINVSMEPFRAFVGDMLPNEQRTHGFAMQTFFIGTGAFIASWLPYIFANWLGVSNVAPIGEIPRTVIMSFVAGAGVFFISVLWTVVFTREYSPQELESFREVDVKNSTDMAPIQYDHTRFLGRGIIWLLAGIASGMVVWFFTLSAELYILAGGLFLFGMVQLLTSWMVNKRLYNGMTEVISDIYSMPATMKQLAVVQFFSWFALFAMWIYSVPAVTSHIYHTSDTTSELYNEGANWMGGMFGLYNLFAAILSFLLPIMARSIGRKAVHMVCLLAGCIGLISFYFIQNPLWLISSMVGVGMAWAGILSMPYAILTGSLPAKKMGVYMGIFNFFIVLPQILAATLLGFFTRTLFDGHSVYALILGGISMGLASVSVLFVRDNN